MPNIMMDTVRLRQLPNVKTWRIEFYLEPGGIENRRRASTGYLIADRRGAEQYLEDWKATQNKKKKKQQCIADILDAYYLEKERTVVNPSSMWAHIETLKQSALGNLLPDQLTRKHYQDYQAKRSTSKTRRGTPIKNGTIRKELGILRAAVRLINGVDLVVEMPAPPPPRVVWLTEEEVDRLLAAAWEVGPHIYLFILLAYTTAARRGAILDLTWDRVLWDIDYIQYSDDQARPTKGRATVPITDANREALQRAYEARQTDHVIEFGGHRVYEVKHAFQAARRRAGLPDWVTAHVLRHTAITHMRAAGVSWEDIADVAGHTTPTITKKVYGHVLPGTHAAVNVLKVRPYDPSSKTTLTTPLAGSGRGSIVPKNQKMGVK